MKKIFVTLFACLMATTLMAQVREYVAVGRNYFAVEEVGAITFHLTDISADNVFYAFGVDNYWEPTETNKMTETVNGIYTIDVTGIGEAWFKIVPESAIENGAVNWVNVLASAVEESVDCVGRTLYAVAADGGAFHIKTAGDYTIIFDKNNLTVTVLPQSSEERIYYAFGVDGKWVPTDTNKMTAVGLGVYTINISTDEAWFKIAPETAIVNGEVLWTYVLGAEIDETQDCSNCTLRAVEGLSVPAFHIMTPGSYTITFNENNYSVTVASQTR